MCVTKVVHCSHNGSIYLFVFSIKSSLSDRRAPSGPLCRTYSEVLGYWHCLPLQLANYYGMQPLQMCLSNCVRVRRPNYIVVLESFCSEMLLAHDNGKFTRFRETLCCIVFDCQKNNQNVTQCLVRVWVYKMCKLSNSDISFNLM